MRALFLAGLALAGCGGAPERPDFEDGRTLADVGARPLPATVTAENAGEVVQICLQRHANLRPSVYYTYIWGPTMVHQVMGLQGHPGFTQHLKLDGGRERTTTVTYTWVNEVSVNRPQEEGGPWKLRLGGDFKIGSESSEYGLLLHAFELECADGASAVALATALRILGSIR